MNRRRVAWYPAVLQNEPIPPNCFDAYIGHESTISNAFQAFGHGRANRLFVQRHARKCGSDRLRSGYYPAFP